MELGVLQAEFGWEEELEGAGNKDNEEELIFVSFVRRGNKEEEEDYQRK